MTQSIAKKLAPRGVLRVGINMSNFLLVNSKDSSGLPDGVSPEIGKRLARELNVKCELVQFAKPGLLADAVNNDLWDVGNIACEKERAKTIEFSDPYVNIDANFIVRNTSNFKTNKNIESVVGFEYENCCFAIRLTGSDKNLSKYVMHKEKIYYPNLADAWDNIIQIENKSSNTPSPVHRP